MHNKTLHFHPKSFQVTFLSLMLKNIWLPIYQLLRQVDLSSILCKLHKHSVQYGCTPPLAPHLTPSLENPSRSTWFTIAMVVLMLATLKFLHLVGSSSDYVLIEAKVIHEGRAKWLWLFPSQQARYCNHIFLQK